MKILTALQELDLGNSVAEFDLALEKYFVETQAFRLISKDQIDIVAGDKGTGKTALFTILLKRYTAIPDLRDVEIVPAFNVTGNPIFQRLNQEQVLSEGQYGTMWKAYFLSLAGNWVLSLYEGALTDSMHELRSLLQRTGLLSADDSPNTIFSTVVNLFRRLMQPNSVEMTVTITPDGLPVVSSRLEFQDTKGSVPEIVPHDEALGLLDRVLAEVGLTLWLILDRLDEAFAGLPAAEVPALRALLRTYLDLVPFENVALKLFVRKDLFRRITEDGFVNLTHVNARKHEITWDEDSLRHLLNLRLRENRSLSVELTVPADEPDMLFARLFPPKVDPGEKKPVTWTWMMSRIRDGNDVKPPRNLIDLVKKSQDAAIRREERERNEYGSGESLLSSESIKSGLSALSKERVEDTLLAEAGAQGQLVERFRNGKAEHNLVSLAEALRIADQDELNAAVRFLRDIGFLETVGVNYKIPMLYRDGLNITQGKAFVGPHPVGGTADGA